MGLLHARALAIVSLAFVLQAAAARAEDVWLDVMVVHASEASKGCDARLSSFEADLREAIPATGYRLISQEAKRVPLEQAVAYDLGNRHEVVVRAVAVSSEGVDLQLLVVDGSTAPAKRMRQAVRIMHHKAFAIGHPVPEGGSNLLVIRTGP